MAATPLLSSSCQATGQVVSSLWSFDAFYTFRKDTQHIKSASYCSLLEQVEEETEEEVDKQVQL